LKKTDSEDGLSTGLSLLYVWKAEPITGLTRLLTLVLRLLTLVEMPGRRGLEQTQESVAGLYKGAPTHPTERPTGTRILVSVCPRAAPLDARAAGEEHRLVSHPLAPLHERLLQHLHLPTSLYTALADNAS
jgi:hypothetical protein